MAAPETFCDVLEHLNRENEELWSSSESVQVGNQRARIAALAHVVQVKRL